MLGSCTWIYIPALVSVSVLRSEIVIQAQARCGILVGIETIIYPAEVISSLQYLQYNSAYLGMQASASVSVNALSSDMPQIIETTA